jgi:multidrug efflux pump subunit AcrA (membrane-fusion protein)
MQQIAIKMLLGDRAKYVTLVSSLTVVSFLFLQQGSIFCGLILRTVRPIEVVGAPIWVSDPQLRSAVWITVSARKPEHAPPLVAPASSPYEHTIAATGVVEASERNFNLVPPISGQLTQLFVKENHLVHRGDKLYQIDNRQQRAAVASAEAAVAKSRATLEVDRATVATQQANLQSAKASVASWRASYDDAKQISDRDEGLHKDGIVSDEAYLTALKAKEGAYGRWQQAKAQEAQLANAKATLIEQQADLEAAIAATSSSMCSSTS